MNTSNDQGGDASISEGHIKFAVTLAKGAVSAIPGVGGLLAEIIANLVPNYRAERIAAYCRLLDERLSKMEGASAAERMKEPERVDLFEEGAQQAARALTDDRIDHIARLVAHGMTGDEKDRIEAKRLLGLLRSLDDDQVIILASYMRKFQEPAFREKHQAVLQPPYATLGGGQEQADRATIAELARAQMMRLGLLRPNFKKPKKSEMPEFDDKTGMIKSTGYELTPLGRMLLIRIGLAEDKDW